MLLGPDQAERVLRIPLAVSSPPNVVVWRYEGFGEYSVKSGYKALFEELHSMGDYLYDTATMSEFYNKMWALQLPSKVKIYMWKLHNNFLPKFGNLAKRKLLVDGDCPLCKEAEETAEHLVRSCHILQDIWMHLKIAVSPAMVASDYKIWWTIHEMVGFDQGYVLEFETISALRLPVQNTMKDLWRPLERGNIKINFDASFHAASHSSISGFIARNDSGQIMGAGTYPNSDVADAFVAEASACERAVIFATEMGFRDVHFERDSLTVIKKIYSREEDKSVLRFKILKIIRGTLTGLLSVLFVGKLAQRRMHLRVKVVGTKRLCTGLKKPHMWWIRLWLRTGFNGYAEEWIAIRSFVAWRNSILYSMEVIKAFSL
ncbi:hypothetical protein Goari_005501 [Gossypium aridum]|uniref:Reverse transcriptase zinc-binding domain-containing protein n=1 Tax=Gossypium aridum TaxID=34290 RepID=A0A7J8YQ96_GOSAI|nr:hypothetical protein [Gossypium aridum]